MQPVINRIFIHSFNKRAVSAYYVPGSLSHSSQQCFCPALISLLLGISDTAGLVDNAEDLYTMRRILKCRLLLPLGPLALTPPA